MITPLTCANHQDVRMAFRESNLSTLPHLWTDLSHLPEARVETFLPRLTSKDHDQSRLFRTPGLTRWTPALLTGARSTPGQHGGAPAAHGRQARKRQTSA